MKIFEVTNPIQIPPMPDVTGIVAGQPKDLGNGESVKLNTDGTYTYSGGFGSVVYDKTGKYLKYMSPSVGGLQQTQNVDGTSNTSYAAGPMSTSQTTDATGKVLKTTGSYDMGLAKLGIEKDNVSGISTTSATPADPSMDPNQLLPTKNIAAAKGVDPKKFAKFQQANPSAVKENELTSLLKIAGLR